MLGARYNRTSKDMSQTIVFINDREVDYRSASVSVFDYTVHCGIGLFESVLGVDRRLIFLDEHLDRMERSIKQLRLRKLNYNRERITRVMRRAVGRHPAKIKKVKLLLTQGYSPLWPGSRPGPKAITIVVDYQLQFVNQSLLISPMTVHTDDRMRGNKTLNFMTEWLSQDAAMDEGYDQGMIINQRGDIAETGSASLFTVKDGELYTPSLDSGGLPGIIRKEVIRLANTNRIPVHEIHMRPEDLISADEVFTTSSFKLIWPVVRVKLDQIYKYRPGPLSRALFERLRSNFMTGKYEDRLDYFRG
jgi:branched-subunit amino acid aminotransferase/4-amino-4-deoxychorismate lyase